MSEPKESDLTPKQAAACENCRMYIEAVYGSGGFRSELLKHFLAILFLEDQDRPIDEPHSLYPGREDSSYMVTDARLEIPDISMKTP